ncbi:MAG TPA: glycosyltransferase family 4 protein [Xanthomonadaceae bacterium]|nr:glycosyltransferase family 4 protein [Xanthomonadaceae bacterium]
MKVLLVSTSFPVSDGSVSGIFVARLADALVTDKEISLEVLAPASIRRSKPDRNGIPIHTFRYAVRRCQRLAHEPGGLPVTLRRSPWQWAFVPSFVTSFFIACLRHGRTAHVLHANWAPTGVIAGIAAWVLRKPLVTTVRGEDANRLAQSRVQQWIMHCCVALSTRVVTVSESISHDISERFPKYKHRIETIPNGVEIRSAEASTDGNAPQTFQIAVVGSLVARKRVDCAIRAVALLPTELRETIKLSILGAGPERDQLVSLAESLGVTSQIDLVGQVDPDEVLDWLSDCHAMAICSDSEGRPNVVMEAMAAGLPILGTNIPGIKELVQHQREGLLFSPGDFAELATHIEAIMKDEMLRRSLSKGASNRIDSLGLSWERCASRYAGIYHQIIFGHL